MTIEVGAPADSQALLVLFVTIVGTDKPQGIGTGRFNIRDLIKFIAVTDRDGIPDFGEPFAASRTLPARMFLTAARQVRIRGFPRFTTRQGRHPHIRDHQIRHLTSIGLAGSRDAFHLRICRIIKLRPTITSLSYTSHRWRLIPLDSTDRWYWLHSKMPQHEGAGLRG